MSREIAQCLNHKMSKRKPYLYVAQQVAHDRAEVSALEVGNRFTDQ